MSTASQEAARTAEAIGPVPEWNLGDLYSGIDAPEIERDLGRLSDEAAAFAATYEGKVTNLAPGVLGRAIEEYEAIEEGVGRIMSFAGLVRAGDMSDPRAAIFEQTMRERVNDLTARLLFFTLELNRIGDAEMEESLRAPEVARYAPWIREVRLFRPHQLSDELEHFIHDKEATGRAAWMRLFDETMARLRFDVDGASLTVTEALNLLSDPDGERRARAGRALARVFKEEGRLFALITNTLAKDKAVEDRWRGFGDPAAARHLANQVEPEVVDALVTAVGARYPDLSHRYYRLKARWLGRDRLDYWDRNAPLPETPDRRIPWQEARETVLGAYAAFSPAMAEAAAHFFDRPWIDAQLRPGKAPGAFSHSTVPSVHPYILLNYEGRPRDVMTLAHELGHGIHQTLAAPLGLLLAETPLTLAETASVFGEMLTFRSLLDGAQARSERKAMLAQKVEDMINTVVRQTAFYQFEHKVHAARREGELSVEELGEIWLGVQRESLGPSFRFDPDYTVYWCYIPHFIHSPFYVYAYAFGDCLVNSLYATYETGFGGFEERYLELLAAGGTKRHRELLAPFGLDAADPAFWSRGLSVISGLIDELEELDRE